MTANADRTPGIPVFYATTEGQTRRIAERLAAALRDRGADARAVDLDGSPGNDVDWPRVRAAAVGASLHMQKHQPAVAAFVARHVAELNAKPTAFFSVSLSAASKNQKEREAAQALADAFPVSVQWAPRHVVSLAGRLAYTQYGFLKRMLLKRIARKEGAPTDTRRDYEFTDWAEVDRLADRLIDAARDAAPASGPVSVA